MDWHFGYNCRNYLPTLDKCRVLIDLYTKRPDLVTAKSLRAPELLVYLGLPEDDVLGKIENGEIEAKQLKDGSLRFRTSASWAWDECPLDDGGGYCIYFEPHDGQKITCLMDLDTLEAEHPNFSIVPSDHDVGIFEKRVVDALRMRPQPPSRCLAEIGAP